MDAPVAPACKICGKTGPPEAFPAYARAKKTCRSCLSARLRASRGRDPVQRALYNLKQRCRERGLVEGRLWSAKDVEKLVAKWNAEAPSELKSAIESSGVQPSYSVKRVDPALPFMPSNARVELAGRFDA
jgi:hypothetical protein